MKGMICLSRRALVGISIEFPLTQALILSTRRITWGTAPLRGNGVIKVLHMLPHKAASEVTSIVSDRPIIVFANAKSV